MKIEESDLEKFPNIKGIQTKEWGLSEKFLSVKLYKKILKS